MRKKGYVAAMVLLALLLTAGVSFAGTTERVSVDSYGNEGNYASVWETSTSADGRYVAFRSWATNLVTGDTNFAMDIFVHDRVTGITERVSVDSSGNQANSDSDFQEITSDGRYVAFQSYATNLVAEDTNGAIDIFVHDRVTGITERVSVDSSGNQADDISRRPAISANGRYVVFESLASNLVPGDTNNAWDIFVHDRETGITVRVSVDSNGMQGNDYSVVPSISSDGQYVAFVSVASNLVPGDTNGYGDIFVYDRMTGIIEIVSVDHSGNQGNNDSNLPCISADGRFVAFVSAASNLVPGDTNGYVDVFVYDRLNSITEIASVGNNGERTNHDYTFNVVISADGRHVAFQTFASSLSPDDNNGNYDIYVHNRETGKLELVSINSYGNQGNYGSYGPSLSSDGRFVSFVSYSTNLVPGDGNGTWDVFVRNRDADSDTFFDSDDCNDNDPTIYPGAAEVKHDGIDQDCNGYDLTIDIIKATYLVKEDSLRVEATSALNGAANLELVGYGPMTWKDNQTKWVINVQVAGGNPGTVTVSGPEGSETAPLQ